jgi:hypothetical protein
MANFVQKVLMVRAQIDINCFEREMLVVIAPKFCLDLTPRAMMVCSGGNRTSARDDHENYG